MHKIFQGVLFILMLIVIMSIQTSVVNAAYEGIPSMSLTDTTQTPAVTISNSGTLKVTHGAAINIKADWDNSELTKMDDTHQYIYRIKMHDYLSNDDNAYGQIDVYIKNRSCTKITYSGSAWGNTNIAGCDVSSNGFSFNNSVLTNKLPIDHQYVLTISSDGNNYRYLGISWKFDQLTLSLDPEGPTPDIYQGAPVVVTASGCPAGLDVKFSWWHGENNVSCITDGKVNCPAAPETKTVPSDQALVASFTQTFNSADPYLIRASCSSVTNAERQFNVISTHGNEKVTFNNNLPIAADTGFNIKFENFTPGQCYFYFIRKGESTYFRPQETEGTLDCNEDGLKKTTWTKDRVYKSSSGWGPVGQSSIIASISDDGDTSEGLPAGDYVLDLRFMKDINNWFDSPGEADEFPFCVGPQCDNIVLPTLPPPAKPPCINDIDVNGGCDGVATGIGSIRTEPEQFIKYIFRVLLSLSGGIALLLIIRAGYQLMTSQGNPEHVKEARELMTSAVVGLLFIVFSYMILTVIGFDILKLPGFGE